MQVRESVCRIWSGAGEVKREKVTTVSVPGVLMEANTVAALKVGVSRV